MKKCRPLLTALADEGDKPSMACCLLPMEKERDFLDEKILKIHTDTGVKRFLCDLYSPRWTRS